MIVIDAQKPSGPGQEPAAPEPPAPEISPVRVVVLLAVLAAVGVAGWHLITRENPAVTAASRTPAVYAPYVDVTQTPTYPFQLPASNPVSSVYLAFIVSDSAEPCRPSWGNYYTLDQADQSLDLDARTAQLRRQGGSVMISFGGQQNTELATACTSTSKLVNGYMEPIERYHAAGIDLDLEGESLADTAADGRRARAVATVQRELAARHTTLKVWMTLPVSDEGLTAEGMAAVRAMLRAHVKLAGVNAMEMNFGAGEGAVHDMIGTVERSLAATQSQVRSLWRTAGLSSSAGAAWGHLGATVMLGVNDASHERFTIRDARALAAFVSRRGIARVSAWSLNRDSECGGAFYRTGIVSNTCSGVVQHPLEFTRIFSNLSGTRTAHGGESEAATATESPATASDDPATSPYPIWRPTAAYGSGYKVVWQGQIYQSSWWNQGTPPGSTAADSPSGPWQLIGPVPPGSHAPKLVKLVSGSLPAWSPSEVYHQGNRVSFDRLPYRARWYTQGEQPLDELPSSPSVPWEPLFEYAGEPSAAAAGTGVE